MELTASTPWVVRRLMRLRWQWDLAFSADAKRQKLADRYYPPALAKACGDPFMYAADIAGFGVIQFEAAHVIDREWVRIEGIQWGATRPPGGDIGPFSFDRGVEVRVSAIRWVADAPYGS